MKSRTLVATVYLGVFVWFFLAGASAAPAGDPSSPAAGLSKGCMQCHSKPSELISKGHPPVVAAGLKDCLQCHGAAEKVTAFATRIHLMHYGASRFPGDCRSCHRIEETGQFGLIGSGTHSKARVSPDIAKKMENYFRSWGVSKHLDHSHAAKGLSCAECHGMALPEKGVLKDHCLRCHGSYEVLSEKSQIHAYMTAPHFDGGDDCGRCHRAHGKAELVCISCHEEMDLKVP